LFDAERENDCFGGLLLAPIDLRGVYLGKLCVQLTFSGLMELCTIPLIFLFFDLFSLMDSARCITLLALLLLGTVGFAIIGTLFAAMLLSTRLRDVLLPIVVYPLVTPVIIAGVQGTRALFGGVEAATHWVTLIGAFDLIYLGLALAIFPKMLRA
jgi:heme exporter protein B